jgi:galactokinase
VDSGVRHVHESSGYTVRQAELARAIESTGLRTPSAVSTQEAMARASAVDLDAVEMRRLRHVVSENERVRAVVAALEAPGGADLAALGRLFRAGHESLRDDYEVSTPELDLLVELAYDHGAVAARLTGGGFGGSVVVLAREDGAAALGEAIADGYATATGRTGTVRITAAADGARELSRP